MTFAHLTLATRDVPRTRDFFAEVFDWRPISRPDNIETEAAWLEIAPEQQLHLLHVPDFEPSAFENEFGRHAAFFQPAGRLPEIQQRLADRGAELIEPQRETPFERFFFRDPNGYVFEVVACDT